MSIARILRHMWVYLAKALQLSDVKQQPRYLAVFWLERTMLFPKKHLKAQFLVSL